MPFLSRQTPYDVCIVGSGAGGGMAAHTLTKAGANVGPDRSGRRCGSRQKTPRCWNGRISHRGAARRPSSASSVSSTRRWAASRSKASPTRRAPGTKFDWFRSRMLGGRTNHWGRISLRFGPYDFNRKSRDGLGDDWPISYDDVKPYYDRVDRLIGLFGSNENLPNEPNGIFQPPPEAALLRATGKAGRGSTEHHLHSLTTLDHHTPVERPRRRATTAGSATADAGPTRTFPRRRCS